MMDVPELYKKLVPLGKSIMNILSFPEALNVEEINTSNHLKHYVKELSSEKLGRFLQFCTGSDLLVSEKITKFCKRHWACKTIVFHNFGRNSTLSWNQIIGRWILSKSNRWLKWLVRYNHDWGFFCSFVLLAATTCFLVFIWVFSLSYPWEGGCYNNAHTFLLLTPDLTFFVYFCW